MDPEEVITCVSDGSNNQTQDFGSFAWILHSENVGNIINGYGFVPGFPVSSFRAESFGKLAWLVFLNEFCYYHHIRWKCTIRSYCDNLGVTKRTKIGMTHLQLTHTLAPSFDVLREISIQQEEALLQICTQHVKGHQDRVKKADQLTLPERINIEADDLATQAFEFFKSKRSSQVQYDLPSGGPYLICDNKAIWSGETELLRWRRSEFALQQYYTDTLKIPPNALQTINWAGFRLARKALTPGLLLFSSKLSIDWLPTNDRARKIGQSSFSECILCGESETTIHLLLCPHRLDTMIEIMDQFYNYLSEINTAPKLQQVLISQLRKWLVLPDTSTPMNPLSDEYACASKVQTEIGWHRFCRGYLANNWSQIQDRFLLTHHCPQLGDSWSSKVSLWWIKKYHEIWLNRNEIQHSKQPGIQSRLEAEVLTKVQNLYNQYELLPASDKELLDMPLSQRLLQPIPTLKRWLAITTPTVQTCVNLFNQVLQQQNHRISSFFPWRDVRNRTTPYLNPTQQQSDSSFLPWRDSRFRSIPESLQNQSPQQHQGEATPGAPLLYTNSQESLSSCRK
jgi:hypothetical protein